MLAAARPETFASSIYGPRSCIKYYFLVLSRVTVLDVDIHEPTDLPSLGKIHFSSSLLGLLSTRGPTSKIQMASSIGKFDR